MTPDTPQTPPTPTPSTPLGKPLVAKVPEKVEVNTLEAAQKECERRQEILTKANEAVVKAHGELMDAQREVERLKASK